MPYIYETFRRHKCKPPRKFWRWLDNVGPGTRWQCGGPTTPAIGCGRFWRLSDDDVWEEE